MAFWPHGPLSSSVSLFDLVNDHPARLIVRERLRMVAIARVHPHPRRRDPATAGPRFFDCAGQQRAAQTTADKFRQQPEVRDLDPAFRVATKLVVSREYVAVIG